MAAARVAELNRGRDIAIIDLREMTPIFDYFVLVTGSSRRQLHAISEEIEKVLKRDFGIVDWASKDTPKATGFCWISATSWCTCLTTRHAPYYDLEQLWGGAKRVPFESSLPAIVPPRRRATPHSRAAC